ncbi:MAG: hypothetical protein WCM76_13355 [Bacteroidota bacterium]
MKKKFYSFCIALFVFALAGYSAMAQSKTLTFNQVLILTNGTSYTVPVNKVWKLESAVYVGIYMDYSTFATAIINSTAVCLIPFSFYDGNSYARTPISTAFPFWAPAGTTVQPTGKTSMISVIEFNVVTTP